jgi:hypothetical protein
MTQAQITEAYTLLCNTPSDINEHLPTLKSYAEGLQHVTEMGVRTIVSTYALLAGKPKEMVSIDINNIDCSSVLKMAGKTTKFKFVQGDTRHIEIDKTDLLFIDTYHNYDQLKIELSLHSSKVRKYIIMHDTSTFATVGESYDGIPKKGLALAISEFLEENRNWVIKEVFENNNGLTILERIA